MQTAGGVSLIELLVVVAIIAILATISVALYGNYSKRAHRTEAMNALNVMYTRQENHRNVNNTYTANLAALGFPGGCTENCVYTIDFTVAPDTRRFTARAQPTPGGGNNGVNQTDDEKCQWLTINAQGVRDSGPYPECWSR